MKKLLWLVLISSAFGQIATNGTTANPVPVTCISGCSGAGSTTANQGTPNIFANAWPVKLTDGTNLLGTPSFPVRVDPTGTTPQPITGNVGILGGSVGLLAGTAQIGHVITDTGSTTAITGSGTTIAGSVFGELNVVQQPNQILSEDFSAALDTTLKWAASSGTGGITPTSAVDQASITMNAGTTLNGFSLLKSIPIFRPQEPGYVYFEDRNQLLSNVSTTTYNFWGLAVVPAAPTIANPVIDGCGFDWLQGTAHLFAVCYQGTAGTTGTRVVIQDLSAGSINPNNSATTAQPTQPANMTSTHKYDMLFSGAKASWLIDGVQVAQFLTGTNGPNNNNLSKVELSVSNSGTANTLIANGIIVADTSKRLGGTVCDATNGFLCAAIKAASTAAVATDQALVVAVSPNSTITTSGGKTNNNAAPGATNLGVLPAIANAATPAWSEGNQVALSTDLIGSLRTNAGQTASVTAAWTNATAQNTAISVITLGYPTVLFTGIATSNTGAIAIEGSSDGGATYPYPINTILFIQNNVQNVSAGGGIQGITNFNSGAGIITVNSAGFTNVRIRLTTVLTAGTLTISLQGSASASQGPIPGGTYILNTGASQGVPVVNVTASNLNATVAQGTGTNLHMVVDSGTVTTVSTVSAARIVGSSGSSIDASVGAGTAPTVGLGQLVRYVSTAPAMTANQTASQQSDSAGTQFVRPYRRSQYKATASTITASTSPVTAVAAQGANIFADVTGFTVTVTAAATTATGFTITLSDGTANYVFDLDTGALATASADPTILSLPFPSPLPATTANTAWTVTSSSATPTMHVVTNFVNNLAN